MARTPADRSTTPSLREQLAEAPAFLKQAGAPAYIAQAVEAVLAPGGWEQLRATDASRDEGTRNLAMNLPETIRDQIKGAAAADPNTVSLTAKVNEGLAAYLEGHFTPQMRPLRMGLAPEARVNLNVTASTVLQRQTAARVQEQVSDPRRGAAWVASEYLMASYRIGPYAAGSRPVLPRGAQRSPEMPRRIRDAIREAAAASGDRVDDIVNEGFTKFLAGEFVPQPVVWRPEDLADMTTLRMHPDDALFEQVKQAVKARPGGVLRPAQVAVDYLLDQLGIDADRAE